MPSFADRLLPSTRRLDVEEVADQLDLDSGERTAKRSTFVVLLLLSAVIAVVGIITDSTATVIGAMIIAPLSTPILGIALGIVGGRGRLAVRSIGWVAAGLGAVVAIGAAMTYAIPDPLSLHTNGQVLGRTSPQLLDLLTAVATGTAGAFAMCRRDLSSILPGVAIAISLVPPLGVVGVCLGEGELDGAFGAFLLFLSNAVALVVAGCVVFTLAGFASAGLSTTAARRRRAYAVVGVVALLVTIPLAVNTTTAVLTARWSAIIRSSASSWLTDVDGATVENVTWHGTQAIIGIRSPTEALPPIEALDGNLAGLPEFVELALDVTVGRIVDVSGTSSG